jgi:hypothetical protein
VAQDFWAASGYRALERSGEGLRLTDAWLRRFLAWDELRPPPEAGARERALHQRMLENPRVPVEAGEIDGVEDADARDNWRAFLRFRDRLLAHATLEAAYRALFARDVDIAPIFVDALAEVLARSALEGCDDAFVVRAAELFFRKQRVSTEAGQVLVADADTIEAHANAQALPMDILNHENALFYWMRDALHSFALDLTAGREGATALARAIELWIAHLLHVSVRVTPVERIEDPHWRWHCGLDAEASALLDALYRGESVGDETLRRVLVLFRLEFIDGANAAAEAEGPPVYLAVAMRSDQTVKVKPQNLIVNLPVVRR